MEVRPVVRERIVLLVVLRGPVVGVSAPAQSRGEADVAVANTSTGPHPEGPEVETSTKAECPGLGTGVVL